MRHTNIIHDTTVAHLCLTWIFSLCTGLVYGQSANPTYSSYSGQTELSGTESVQLLSGFHAPAGSTLRVFITAVTTLGNGASSNQNYIQTTRYLSPVDAPLASPTTEQAMRDIVYYDGLGRPLQEVQVKASGGTGFKDLVIPIAYDAYGRQEYQYLPYATATGAGGTFKTNAVTAQSSYYSGSTTVPAGQTAHAYARSRTVFEPSPLNRVLEQGFPGQAWQPASSRTTTTGHTVATQYTANNATAFGTVATTRMASSYGVTLSTSGVPTLTLNSTYAAGELYVTVTKDEDWNGQTGTFAGRLHTTEEYRDKQDRVVLRRTFNGTSELLSTYYVYNDLGQLSFVLTPELGPDRTGTTAPTTTELDNYAYQYRYDGRGRLKGKKLPGKDWEFFVYNKMNQVAMSQDGRQRAEPDGNGKQYMGFTKYDGQGRVVITGVERGHDGGSSADYAANYAQGIIDGTTNQWEERSTASGNLHGYTNRSIPWGDVPANPATFDVLEVNYYDRYDGIPGLPDNQSASHSKLTHGRLVASKAKVIGTSSTYLWTVYYYDDRGNVAATYSQHYKGGTVTGNYDRTTTTYTFTGKVKLVSRKHFTGGTQQVQVNTDHVYDHRERLVDTWMQVNAGSTPYHISRNQYNEVGQVWKKENNGVDGITLDYATAYSYNERGWLRTANGTLFSQELRYNMGSTKYFNGNIAYQVFSRKHTTGSTVGGTYTYTYDGVNRLTQGTMAGNLGREILTYDRNGNINTLRRTDESGATVDSLAYGYIGNRLTSVNDRSTNAALQFMLRGVTSYTHDANGNVKKRTNTTASGDDITGTVYNHLDLPQSVTASGATVTYTYDGSGRKLRSVNGINGQTRDYVDGIEYYNGTLELIHMPEGRILKSGSNYTYEYMLRDHLGNTRSAFAGSATGTAKFGMDYYPFGLQYPGNAGPGSPKNNYLYNGKELQDKLKWYDYGARFYDPVIGRWGSVDPLAESFQSYSPYNYGLNNPIIMIDPTGMAASPIYDRYGIFLGTDDQGLQGDAIVMNHKDFQQGMSHSEAKKKDLGFEGLFNKSNQKKLLNHYNTLKDRPDYDGVVTMQEGIEWALSHPYSKNHPHNALFLDAGQMDFGHLSVNDLIEGVSGNVNLFNFVDLSSESSVNTTYALGNTQLKLISAKNRTVQLYSDKYDWDYHQKGYQDSYFKLPNSTRDRLIWAERRRTGINNSHGFPVYIYGVGKLR